jgi:hypothetical protein
MLKFIGKTKMVNTSKFYHLKMSNMIDAPKFKMYLHNLPLQSKLMKSIQSLKKREGGFANGLLQIDDSIQLLKHSNSFCIERGFIEKDWRDQKGFCTGSRFKQYPVEVFALPVDWIMSDKENAGKNFLNKILQ